MLLNLDYEAYSLCLAQFFEIEPLAGETIALDGKVLRGSYIRSTPASTTESHSAIQLVSVYVVERGLILPVQQVDKKSNEITALPPVLKTLARRGMVFAFDALNTPGLFHSEKELEYIQTLFNLTLSLSHIDKAVVTIEIER